MKVGSTQWRDMESRAAHVEYVNQVRGYGLDPLLWWFHFGDILPEAACCDVCHDVMTGLCRGDDRGPLACMWGGVSCP